MWPYFCCWSYHLNTPFYGIIFYGPLQLRSNTAFCMVEHYPKSLTLLLDVCHAALLGIPAVLIDPPTDLDVGPRL